MTQAPTSSNQTGESTKKKLEPKISINTKIKIQQALSKCEVEPIDAKLNDQIKSLPKSDV